MDDDFDFDERERDRQESRERDGRDRDREIRNYPPGYLPPDYIDLLTTPDGLASRTIGEYLSVQDELIEDDDRCVYCLHRVSRHDNAVPGCLVCGCTRVVFDDGE